MSDDTGEGGGSGLGTYFLKGLIGLVWIYVIACPIVMIFEYSRAFGEFSPRPEAAVAEGRVEGLAYVDAIIHAYETAMKPWLPNDKAYPAILLDNPQNFQLGVLEAQRYALRVLRDDLTRQRTTDALDRDVEEAHNQFQINPDYWMFPQAEDEYAKGIEALKRYRARLARGEANFYPRADNLAQVLDQFNSLTGGANQRLYNCIGEFDRRISDDTADDPYAEDEGKTVAAEVGWTEVDDQFYYAQGVAFVYREVMQAITVDFHEILELRKANQLARSIVVDYLDNAQFEPIYVANGGYGSMLANHPYQLLAMLSQVREKSRSLVSMLEK